MIARDVCARVLQKAVSTGADYAEIFAENTVNHAVRGEMESFTSRGMHTLAIAGAIAVGILLISTVFRLWAVWKQNRKN